MLKVLKKSILAHVRINRTLTGEGRSEVPKYLATNLSFEEDLAKNALL